MSPLALAAAVVATAVLSSVLTVLGARAVFERRGRELREEIERDLESRLDDALERMGVVIEERVRKGVLDAIARIPTTEVAKSATRAAARTGTRIVEEGLNLLLDPDRRRR